MCYSWAQHKQMYTLHADSRPEKCQFTLNTAPCSACRLPTMYFSWIHILVLDIFYQQLGGFMSIGGVVAPFAGMGNEHYLEYVHTFILEYFPSEYYKKHISLIICFKTVFVNLGVLLSRGNSNIFQGPNLPGPNLTIRTIQVWYRYQDELGFHPAVKGVAPLSWKEVLPLFLSFFDYCTLYLFLQGPPPE